MRWRKRLQFVKVHSPSGWMSEVVVDAPLTLKAASIWALRMLHLRWSGRMAGDVGGCRDFSDSCFSSPCRWNGRGGQLNTAWTTSNRPSGRAQGLITVNSSRHVSHLVVHVDVERRPRRRITLGLQCLEQRMRDVQLVGGAGRSPAL